MMDIVVAAFHVSTMRFVFAANYRRNYRTIAVR